jgi:hypothetical protein
MKKIFFLLMTLCILCFVSCENEPAQFTEGNLDVVDQELLDYLTVITSSTSEETVRCVRFNYSFTVFTYDADFELKSAQAVFNNAGFIMLLEDLNPEHTISINYPISGTLNNGDLVEITNNEELKTALKSCFQEEILRRCNNTLVDCNWTVTAIPESPHEFEEAIYKVDSEGTVQLHVGSDVYFGTWVTLYIGDDLYLNIDLNDDAEVEGFWDHNWNVAIFTNQQITLNNDEQSISITKDCSIACLAEGYQVCEIDSTPGTAQFNLDKYIPCLPIPFEHDIISALNYSFFETEEEALSNINALEATAYLNTENPQIIFIRIAYKTSDELLEVIPLTIEAVSCSG